MAKKKPIIDASPQTNKTKSAARPHIRSHRKLFGPDALLGDGTGKGLQFERNFPGNIRETTGRFRESRDLTADEQAWNARPRPRGSRQDIHLPTNKRKK